MIDYTTDNIELSELQAVDFALGTFVAKAFSGQRTNKGSKEWREFLARDVKKQVYRGDDEDPAEFLKKLVKNTGEPVKFPVVYYFRKPGFTNSDNNRAMVGAAKIQNGSPFDVASLPISLDYRLYLLAWDKPTLDRLSLAWYAYINAKSYTFPVNYQIDDEAFPVKAFIADNRTVTLSDITPASANPGSKPAFYGVNTALTINTQVLQGAAVPAPPETVFVYVGLLNHRKETRSVAVTSGADVVLAYGTLLRLGVIEPFAPGYVEIYAGRDYLGSDDGNGGLYGVKTIGGTRYTLTGAVDYELGITSIYVVPPLPSGLEIVLNYTTEHGLVAAGCPDCHDYRLR